MNPFIDPNTSRDHFPLFDQGIAIKKSEKTIVNKKEPNEINLDWSIDTLAHMAALKGDGQIQSQEINHKDNPDHAAQDLASVEAFWNDPNRDEKLVLLKTPIRNNNALMQQLSPDSSFNYSSSSGEQLSRFGDDFEGSPTSTSIADEFKLWHQQTLTSIQSPQPKDLNQISSSSSFPSPLPHPATSQEEHALKFVPSAQKPPVTPAPSRLRDPYVTSQPGGNSGTSRLPPTPEWGSAVKKHSSPITTPAAKSPGFSDYSPIGNSSRNLRMNSSPNFDMGDNADDQQFSFEVPPNIRSRSSTLKSLNSFDSAVSDFHQEFETWSPPQSPKQSFVYSSPFISPPRIRGQLNISSGSLPIPPHLSLEEDEENEDEGLEDSQIENGEEDFIQRPEQIEITTSVEFVSSTRGPPLFEESPPASTHKTNNQCSKKHNTVTSPMKSFNNKRNDPRTSDQSNRFDFEEPSLSPPRILGVAPNSCEFQSGSVGNRSDLFRTREHHLEGVSKSLFMDETEEKVDTTLHSISLLNSSGSSSLLALSLLEREETHKTEKIRQTTTPCPNSATTTPEKHREERLEGLIEELCGLSKDLRQLCSQQTELIQHQKQHNIILPPTMARNPDLNVDNINQANEVSTENNVKEIHSQTSSSKHKPLYDAKYEEHRKRRDQPTMPLDVFVPLRRVQSTSSIEDILPPPLDWDVWRPEVQTSSFRRLDVSPSFSREMSVWQQRYDYQSSRVRISTAISKRWSYM